MAARLRKQRVALRFRRREQLKQTIRQGVVRSATLALIVGFGAVLFAKRNSVILRFVRQHTPRVTVQSPETLVGLPVVAQLPQNSSWLWFPGSGWIVEHGLCRHYPAVRSVFLERHFQNNSVIVHLVPRVPLVTWNGQGFDRDGVLFAITPGAWKALPRAVFLASGSKRELGAWLFRLQGITPLWSQVLSLRQDAYGAVELTLRTGTLVVWGPTEIPTAGRKAQTLVRVLDDAHQHLGGTAQADLRFFDQGRIIVRPKGR